MRRRIAIIALAVAALTVGPASAAQAAPLKPANTLPSFCLDLGFGLPALCVPAVV